jgi:hypothetical protein
VKFLAANSVGKQTVKLNNAPSVIATASIVGPKEGQGPLGQYFDKVLDDDLYGEKSWEKAEAKFFQEAVEKVIVKGHKDKQEINYLLGVTYSTSLYRPISLPGSSAYRFSDYMVHVPPCQRPWHWGLCWWTVVMRII